MKLGQSEEASWQYSVRSGSATSIPSWSLQAGHIAWSGIWGGHLVQGCKRLPGESCSWDHAINHLCSVFTVAQVKLCNPCGTSCVQLCSSAFYMRERQWITSVVTSPTCWLLSWPWTGWWCSGRQGHWEPSYGLCHFSCASPVCGLRSSDCPRLSLL